MSDYVLYHADCLDVLEHQLAQSSVDLVLADIPYGRTDCAWDAAIPLADMWRAVDRVTRPKRAQVLFSQQPFTAVLTFSNIKRYRHSWVWVKDRKSNQMNAKKMPMRGHEDLTIFGDQGVIYNRILKPRSVAITAKTPKTKTDVYISRQNDSYRRRTDSICPDTVLYFPVARGLHPTQKPVELLEYLIKTYSNPGDTVLDFTMGSGSTGEAAANTGRRFIGVELYPLAGHPIDKRKNPDYFSIAEHRVATAYARAAAERQAMMML